MQEFFGSFKEATLETSADKKQTLSYVVPWYNILLEHVEQLSDEYVEKLRNFSSNSRTKRNSRQDRIQRTPGKETLENLLDAAECAKNKLESYFNISSDYCILAVVLDPRQKLQFYDDESKSDDENALERSKIYTQIKFFYMKNMCQKVYLLVWIKKTVEFSKKGELTQAIN